MMKSTLAKTTSVALVALGAIWTGCAPDNPTEFVAGISTQVQIPKEMRSVRIDIAINEVPYACYQHKAYNGRVVLPRTLGVVNPPERGDDRSTITISIYGFTASIDAGENKDGVVPAALLDCGAQVEVGAGQEQARVLRRSRQPYRQGHILYVPMPLRYSCFDVNCPEGQTCKGGQCAAADVVSETLAEYSDDLLNGNTNTCFSSTRCLGAAVPPTLLDPARCLYSTQTDGDGLNVRAIYDGFVSEVLDEDRDEGFYIPDPAKPNEFQLAPGLCNPNAVKKILNITASRACPQKRVTQPMCNDTAEVLIPAPSALYVLMDKSPDSAPFFGAAGLSKVLGVPLQDPVFSTTHVAFNFVPSPDACSPQASFANPVVDFSLAFTAQRKVADAIGAIDGATIPPNPNMGLGAVLDNNNGIYSRLRSFVKDQPLPFNRKAAVIITSRDVNAGCSGNPAAGAAAAVAQDDTQTYVVLLKPPSGPPPQSVVDNATALAMAGGTSKLYNAINDPVIAPGEALAELVSSLSSCLYQRPGKITGTDAVLTAAGETIPFDANCSRTNAGAQGWNFDDTAIDPLQPLEQQTNKRMIRICGTPCAHIREFSKNTNGLNSGLQGQGLPPVAPPLLVTATQP
jgi:hypothetical protein